MGEALHGPRRKPALDLTLLLRLAVRLHHSRSDEDFHGFLPGG